MKMRNYYILSVIFMGIYMNCCGQDSVKYVPRDTLIFTGQLSAWGLYNQMNSVPVYGSLRYIPTLNYAIKLQNNRQFDFEGSANAFGVLGIRPFDETHSDGSLQPYRAWARYSSRYLEVRVGLQKINFGSATLLRPLMWFDQLDPRDPLQLTNGVWGALVRYYFPNNANLWLWSLYGNNKPRPWAMDLTNPDQPEFGGRFQSPIPKGELGITFHHRVTDFQGSDLSVLPYHEADENRIGLDGKWDLGVGLWFEGTLVHKSKDAGILTNTEILNLGTDNTFAIGNGLNIVFEQLLLSYDRKALTFSNPISFSGLSLSYPIGMLDNLNLISYFSWTNNTSYNFLNFKRQFDKITFYIMAFWNPRNYQLPQQVNAGNYYSGKGIQLMLVFNH